ncbi:site-specific integrase [Paenibacillus sp. BC26]|uniref:site-specific integrase n=1 Tax=Paenibacillus sp. BC26 TaxID=1881032 RepID=UPI0008E30805|nr:site-specific integrase [Paenibacillus sp. BC26]SFS83833.1 Site-specific recombinase XerD [Paenibacillus sp. BC26]
MAGSVRKDGTTWYYILERTENGKRKQSKKRGFSTKKEAQRALVEAQSALNSGTYVNPSKLTVAEYLLEWMNDKQHTIGRETASNNLIYIRNHITPMIGNIALSKLSALDIQRVTTRMFEKGLASSTIKRTFNIINTALNKAEKMQLITRNVASFVDKPKVKKKELEVWDIHEIQQFLETATTSRYYIAFHLAIMTGMRQGEILGLRWQDVDFEHCKIYIRQTLSHDGKDFKAGAKTVSGIRSVSVDPTTIEYLKKHNRIMENEKRLAKGVFFDKGLVIHTSTGNQLIPRNLMREFKQLLIMADMRKITFHDLRHTHASLLLRQNVHPKIVSERLGHSSIKLTLDIYSHLLPNMQKEAADNLAQLVFN